MISRQGYWGNQARAEAGRWGKRCWADCPWSGRWSGGRFSYNVFIPECQHPSPLVRLLTFFRWVCTRAISRTKILSCSWRRTPPSSCQTSTTSSVCFKRFPCTLTLALGLQYIYHFSGFPFLTTETFASHTTQQQSPKQMSITTYKSFRNWNVQGVSSKKDFLFEIWQLQYSECCFLNTTHIFSNSVLCKQMILSMKKTSLS